MYPKMGPQTLGTVSIQMNENCKLDRWAMLLQEYNITFCNIKGKDNILADAISQLRMINIYEDPTEDRLPHSPTT